jgi:hypothetical protein
MSLPARQQQALDQIESQFEVAEPQLMAMFAAFTRVAKTEAMPAREVIGRRLPQLLLICVMALTVIGAVLLGTLVGSPRCQRALSGSKMAHIAAVANCKPATTAGSSGR